MDWKIETGKFEISNSETVELKISKIKMDVSKLEVSQKQKSNLKASKLTISNSKTLSDKGSRNKLFWALLDSTVGYFLLVCLTSPVTIFGTGLCMISGWSHLCMLELSAFLLTATPCCRLSNTKVSYSIISYQAQRLLVCRTVSCLVYLITHWLFF